MERREALKAGLGAAIAAALPPGARAQQEADRMIERRIPSSGELLPVIGLGTSGPFEVGASREQRAPLAEVLQAFFAGGGRVIDTSPMYSTAEDVLGDLLTPEMQRQAFLATKVWTDGREAGIAQMMRSGERLMRRRLDLIQVHNLRDLATHLQTLRDWKEQGRVRYIGITHYTVASHDDLARIVEREKLDFVQLNYSPVTRNAEQRLLPLAADRGVAVLVNRAFEDGALFGRVRGREVPAWAREFDAGSWAQVFLKYVIAHPAVTCVIPATGKVRNLRDNLGGGRGRLPDAAQRAKIAALLDAA